MPDRRHRPTITQAELRRLARAADDTGRVIEVDCGGRTIRIPPKGGTVAETEPTAYDEWKARRDARGPARPA